MTEIKTLLSMSFKILYGSFNDYMSGKMMQFLVNNKLITNVSQN